MMIVKMNQSDCSECIDGQCASPHIVPPILPKPLKKCSTIVNGEIHKGYIYPQDFLFLEQIGQQENPMPLDSGFIMNLVKIITLAIKFRV